MTGILGGMLVCVAPGAPSYAGLRGQVVGQVTVVSPDGALLNQRAVLVMLDGKRGAEAELIVVPAQLLELAEPEVPAIVPMVLKVLVAGDAQDAQDPEDDDG